MIIIKLHKTLIKCQAFLTLVALSIVGLTGAILAQELIKTQDPIQGVATYSILGDFVKNVGGDLVELTVLVGPDGDAHEYEPTPQDSVAIANADLIFENGLEFESWLNDLYTASGSDAMRVVVTVGVVPRPIQEFGDHAEEEDHADDSSEGEDHAHKHGEFDPHVWHNPQLVATIIDNIAAALTQVDAGNEATYLANATAYKAELEQLDKDIQAKVDTLPADKRKLITSHDALGYFAYRYGFEVMGAVIPSVTTESSDANAGELADLIDTIQNSGVKVIFIENITNTDLVEQVASSAGATLAPGLYTDALGQKGSEGETYLDMMRYNAQTIVNALKQ